MITNRFLHYKTKAAFENDINAGLIQNADKCIAFIKDEALIWTHGKYYGGTSDVQNLYNNLSEKVQKITDDIKDIYGQIDSLDYSLNSILETLEIDSMSIIEKFNAISEFLESLPTDDKTALLDSIISRITDEESRAKAAEKNLQDQIDNIQTNVKDVWRFGNEFPIIFSGTKEVQTDWRFGSKFPIVFSSTSNTPTPTSGDGIKHVILEKGEYDKLTQYDDNTIYFILKSAEWQFDDEFPVTLV